MPAELLPRQLQPVILISALASNAGGSGHVVRMASLVDEVLRRKDVRVVFHTNPMGAAVLARRLPLRGGDLQIVMAPDVPDAACEDLIAVASRLRPRVTVLDNYTWDAGRERSLLPLCGRLVVFDDLADRAHLADVLIDQNPNRQPGDYAGLVPDGCRLAVGPAFCLLSRDVRAARAAGLPDPALRAGRDLVFVSLGGGDPGRDLLRVVDTILGGTALRLTVATGSHIPDAPALQRLATDMPARLDLALDSTRVPAQMLAAGLAVASAGTLTWERAALGLPGLGLIVADNQAPAARWLQDHGLQTGFDLRGGWNSADLLTALNRLVTDPAQRQAQGAALARLIDGTGVATVADLLLEPDQPKPAAHAPKRSP